MFWYTRTHTLSIVTVMSRCVQCNRAGMNMCSECKQFYASIERAAPHLLEIAAIVRTSAGLSIFLIHKHSCSFFQTFLSHSLSHFLSLAHMHISAIVAQRPLAVATSSAAQLCTLANMHSDTYCSLYTRLNWSPAINVLNGCGYIMQPIEYVDVKSRIC